VPPTRTASISSTRFGRARSRVATLPAAARLLLVASAEGVDTLRLDIRLQGDRETPFFDL
jgi:hypothetical protein